jgi:hypothetical protein
MDDRHALAIVSALANGANPITGEMFASDSPYQSPDVIRALFVATRALESQVGAAGVRVTPMATESANDRSESKPSRAPDKAPQSARPGQSNAGKPWTADEDKQLLAAFDGNAPLAEIAKAHGRTQNGVRARLEKHGRLQPSDATRWPSRADVSQKGASHKNLAHDQQYPESSRRS